MGSVSHAETTSSSDQNACALNLTNQQKHRNWGWVNKIISLFASPADSLPVPQVGIRNEGGQPGAPILEVDLGSTQEFLSTLNELNTANRAIVEERPGVHTTLDGSRPERLAQISQIAGQVNEHDYVLGFMRHRKDGMTTHEHSMELFRRGENEEPTEQWRSSYAHFESLAEAYDNFPNEIADTVIEGTEAMLAYHQLRLAQIKEGINSRFFTKIRTDANGQKFSWRERGYEVEIVRLQKNAEGEIEIISVDKMVLRSYEGFTSKMNSLLHQFRETYGVSPSTREIFGSLLPSADERARMLSEFYRSWLYPIALINPFTQNMDRSASKFLMAWWIWPKESVMWSVRYGWRFFRHGVIGGITNVVTGTGAWIWSGYRQTGKPREIALTQAFLRWRLQIAHDTLMQRVEDLGFELSEDETALLHKIQTVMSKPENSPDTFSVNFAEDIILKDERRIAQLKDRMQDGVVIPRENRTRQANNDFHVNEENIESANDNRWLEKLKDVRNSLRTSVFTILGTSALSAGVAISSVTFVVSDSPTVSYYRSLAYETYNDAFRYVFGTVPDTRASTNASGRKFGLDATVTSNVNERINRPFEEARLADTEEAYLAALQEARLNAFRIYTEEVLPHREETGTAAGQRIAEDVLVDAAIPWRITGHVKYDMQERFPTFAEKIEELFELFTKDLAPEGRLNTAEFLEAVVEARLANEINHRVYSDLRWYITFGYQQSFDHYYSENWGDQLITERAGGPYQSIAKAPSFIRKIEIDTTVYNQSTGEERHISFKTEIEREVFVINSNDETGLSQVVFADTNVRSSDTGFFYVPTENIERLEAIDELLNEEDDGEAD